MTNDIKLIAIDLDQTLLDHDLKIPERNREVLAEAARQGVTIAIATGRTHDSAERFAVELGIDAPVISYNGAMIRKPGADEPMRHVRLDPDIAAEIVETVVHEMIDFIYFLDDDLYTARFDHWARRYLRRTGDLVQIAGDLRKLAGNSPTKILMMGTPQATIERYEQFRAQYGERIYCTISLPEYMEVLNPQATKATALLWLAEHLGIPIEHTMALGDSLNDLEMVCTAGVGVFMPIADTELQEQADFIPTSAREGVAEAVEQLVLGREPVPEGGGQ
ncbi:MAG: HAD family phosphatase [candidate division WS1 bacterium]|nr:HAD family phosphatase [candidate division WS1 bacterium]